MKTFIVGDIHGEINQLKKCLEIVNFDFEKDQLIQLGDVVDRGPDSYGCIELLLKIRNTVFIKGNHDDCWFQYLKTGKQDVLWNQGGRETYQSYIDIGISPEIHFDFFAKQVPYYIDENRNCFVHGGFNRHHLITEQSNISDLWWDRDLFLAALSYKGMKNQTHPFKMRDNFKEVFVGHTPVQYWGFTEPVNAANIWNLDTGCGKGEVNPLTIMDLETHKFWQA